MCAINLAYMDLYFFTWPVGVCSGRADYFGLAVNRAARFLGAACGGQVLAERGLVEEVVQYWHSLVYKCAVASPCPVVHAPAGLLVVGTVALLLQFVCKLCRRGEGAIAV